MKVVLDTNCILQIVFPKACYKEAWDALLANKYTICVLSLLIQMIINLLIAPSQLGQLSL